MPYLGVDRLAHPCVSERLQRLAPAGGRAAGGAARRPEPRHRLLIIRHFQADATATSRLYSGVFGGLNDPRPGAEAEALLRLGEQVRALGLPLVVTDRHGPGDRRRPTCRSRRRWTIPRVQGVRRAARPAEPADRGRGDRHGALRAAAGPAQPDRAGGAAGAHHRGDGGGGGVRLPERDGGPARPALGGDGARGRPPDGHAAHQPAGLDRAGPLAARRRRPDLADHLAADAERLDRVAQRFERIGNPAKREPIGLGALADRVAGYFRPRLPRRANPIELRLEAPGAGPDGAGRSGAARVGAGGTGEERDRCAAGTAPARLSCGSAPRRAWARSGSSTTGPGVAQGDPPRRCSSPASPPSAAAGASASRSRAGWWRTPTDGVLVLEPTEQGSLFPDSHSAGGAGRRDRYRRRPNCEHALNPAQREAVEHVARAAAGAGRRGLGEDPRPHHPDRRA